jgi:hypothetical protein
MPVSDPQSPATDGPTGRPAVAADEPPGNRGGTGVFVNDDGDPRRIVQVVGWVFGGLMVAWLALVGASLTGAPWVPKVALPGLGPVLTRPQGSSTAGRDRAGPTLTGRAAKVDSVATRATNGGSDHAGTSGPGTSSTSAVRSGVESTATDTAPAATPAAPVTVTTVPPGTTPAPSTPPGTTAPGKGHVPTTTTHTTPARNPHATTTTTSVPVTTTRPHGKK